MVDITVMWFIIFLKKKQLVILWISYYDNYYIVNGVYQPTYNWGDTIL